MAKVISLENWKRKKVGNTIREIEVLLGKVSTSLGTAKEKLDKQPLNVNLVEVAKKIVQELPSAKKNVSLLHYKIQNFEEFLNLSDRKNIDSYSYMMYLVGDLGIKMLHIKRDLKEITLRSKAPVLAQVVVKKDLIPALGILGKIWDELQALKERSRLVA